LHTNKYKNTLSAFVKETSIELKGDQSQQMLKNAGAQDKKWTAVVRLQKKIADLETQLEKKDQEIQSVRVRIIGLNWPYTKR
jgi:hypothetical protein